MVASVSGSRLDSVRSFQRTYLLSDSGAGANPDSCPLELVVEALGIWIVRTLSAVADAKQINLGAGSVTVHLTESDVQPGQARISITLNLERDLDHRQRSILANSARSCEVSKLLTGDTLVDCQVM